MIADIIIPAIFLALFLAITFKRLPAYDIFIEGAKKAINICVNIFPYLATIFIAVELMKISGVTDMLASALSPVFSALGVPGELIQLIIIRPFSGSASLGIYNTILDNHGPDSYISRSASVIMGSSETVFYVASVYFVSSGVKRLRYGIPVCLIAMAVGIVAACWLCRVM